MTDIERNELAAAVKKASEDVERAFLKVQALLQRYYPALVEKGDVIK
jgi:hypothetical protein